MSKKKYSERVTPMGMPRTRLDDLPDLIEVQKKSFEWFLKEGLKEEFLSYSPIKDYTGRLELHFLPNYTFDNPKYSLEEARIHDATYAKQLRVMVRLVNRDTGEIKEQEVYIGDIPTMTNKGTFIVNGAERVIVSQIVRSPGIYFKREISPTGKRLFNATLISNRGAWLKIETDANDIISVKTINVNKLRVGDDIAYIGKRGGVEGLVISHRIIRIDKNENNKVEMLFTKGINSDLEDPSIEPSQVLGRVGGILPIITPLNHIIKNIYGFFFLVFCPLVLVICMEIAEARLAIRLDKEELVKISDLEKVDEKDDDVI